jgi:hypothetical protein
MFFEWVELYYKPTTNQEVYRSFSILHYKTYSYMYTGHATMI